VDINGNIGLIVCGAGYMGKTNFLEGAFPSLVSMFKQNCIRLYVIEPDEVSRKEVSKLFKDYASKYKHLDHCKVYATNKLLYEYLERENILTKLDLLLFYDSSPTDYHYTYLSEFFEEVSYNLNIKTRIYLGEKPLCADVTSLNDINDAPHELVFCDLIEMVNPTFINTKEYIEKQKLDIIELNFWRAGSFAIEKLLNPNNRGGVQGGALLDKSPHDFSISVGLLGMDNIHGESPEIFIHSDNEKVDIGSGNCIQPMEVPYIENTEAKYINFSIHPSSYSGKDEKCILNALNEKLFQDEFNNFPSDWKKGPMPKKMPADGMLSCSFDWKLKNGNLVRSNYLFSWVGVISEIEKGVFNKEENYFIELLKKFNLDHTKWIDYQVSHKANIEHQKLLNKRFPIEDVRIGIIKVRDNNGTESYIVCNFLVSKSGSDIKRFAYHYDFEGKSIGTIYEDQSLLETEKNYTDIKQGSLADIFTKIIFKSLKPKEYAYLSKNAALLAHGPIFKVQEVAIKNLKKSFNENNQFDYWFDKSKQIFDHKFGLQIKRAEISSAD